MNTRYILFVIFLIQLSLKYGAAQIISTSDTCENGEKVEYRHHIECRCPANWVHETEKKCIEKKDLASCEAETDKDKPCGDFATCTEDSGSLVCTCKTGYTSATKSRSLKTGDMVCIPTLCKNVDCKNGVCRLNSNGKAMCSCKQGFGREDEDTLTSECNKEEENFDCTLTCPDKLKCEENIDKGYMHCKCENKDHILINDTCASSAFKLFLSPINIIFILVVSFISLKSA